MGNAGLTPVEANKHKAEPAHLPAMKREGSAAIPGIPNFLGAAGNMAIQRAASGPLAGNPSAAAILGGANMSSGGCSCGGSGSCAECKKKPLQRKGEGDAAGISPGFHSAMNRSGGGAPLASHTRSAMEQRFGENFDNVRVHSDGAAADASRSIRAHAFTTGRDIYFGQGRYEPHSVSGQKLLAHELTHVLQQRQGVVKPGLKSLTANAQNDDFEREAEQAEAHVDREEHGVHARIPSASRSAHAGTGGSHSVQRKCACGGTCSKCSGEGHAPAVAELNKTLLQRKCACGGTCASCSGKVEELKTPVVQGKAEASVEPQRERSLGAREKSPSQKQRQRDGLRGDKLAGPQSATGANGRGRRAVRSLAKAMPSILRSAATDSQSGSGTHNYKFEKEADHAANEVAHGRNVASEKLTALGGESIQPSGWEWCNPFTDPDCGVRSTAGVIKDEASDIAEEVWDEAKSLAKAVGGFLTYINNLLTITIPPKHILNAHSFQTDLPELAMDLPFLEGIVPIAPGVEIYGEVGLHLGIIPEIGLQLGPFDTHAIKIAIHPLTLDGEVTGGFDLTIAGLLGGEARAGIFGEVGVIIEWPDPPLVLKVPIANIQAGLAGTLRGMLGDHMSVDFHGEAGITGFSFSLDQHHDLGFAVDLGLAGYGQLSVLGINLCTLKWPLYEAHKDAVLSLDLDFSVGSLIGGGSGYSGGGGSSGGGGASGDYGDNIGGAVPSISSRAPSAASISPKSWDDLGIQFQRQVNKDDCPLCQFLHDFHLFPSQRVGPWPFHPTAPWAGPLTGIYPIDPGDMIPKWHGGKCRGACGVDCSKCKDMGEVFACELIGNHHRIWKYPHFNLCPTHKGCRDHDACYDWCANKLYERGPLGIIFGPCHRLCDMDCVCEHSLPECVNWIFGKGGDDIMKFSDKPVDMGGCVGPCPAKVGRKGGHESWLLCLPTIELFRRKNVTADPLDVTTGKHTIFRKDVFVPYAGLVTLEIFASGKVHGDLSAGLGPGTLNNICFDVDPSAGSYKARGEVRVPADFLANLIATAELGADAKWFLIVKVASAKGVLEASGLLAGKATLVLSGMVDLSCRGGKPTLESDLDIPGCLSLQLDLKAGFDIEAVGFEVFSKKWKLASAKWDKCWGEDVLLKHTGKDPKIDLTDKTINLPDLLEFLLSDKAEKTEPANQQRQVKESPLTAATAKTIPELAPQLDQTSQSAGAVTLRSGASSTVGLNMMTRFLTLDHAPGSDKTGPAQKNIYGFRKLPQRGAFGGSGFSATQVYIKGHLLNAKLGGPAQDDNLFPITGQANSEHSNQVENVVKGLVKDQRLVAMYGVRVTGQDGPHEVDVLGDGTCTYEFLNSSLECSFGNYTLFTDNTVELLPVTDKTIGSTFDRSGFIAGVKAKNCPEK